MKVLIVLWLIEKISNRSQAVFWNPVRFGLNSVVRFRTNRERTKKKYAELNPTQPSQGEFKSNLSWNFFLIDFQPNSNPYFHFFLIFFEFHWRKWKFGFELGISDFYRIFIFRTWNRIKCDQTEMNKTKRCRTLPY